MSVIVFRCRNIREMDFLFFFFRLCANGNSKCDPLGLLSMFSDVQQKYPARGNWQALATVF